MLAGSEVFGFVGIRRSGKTHFLKALTLPPRPPRRRRASARRVEFRRADVPGQTAADVFHYDYTGPDRRAAGPSSTPAASSTSGCATTTGELQRGRASSSPRWLRRCRGPVLLPPSPPRPLRRPPCSTSIRRWAAIDGRAPHARGAASSKERDAREELEFFKHFLLFLRALRAADRAATARRRSVRALPPRPRTAWRRRCATTSATAPLLDVPVMFFFTQADAYEREDFAHRARPSTSSRASSTARLAAFTARYLPCLFGAVASQVERFKFDFLQSYEEHDRDRAAHGASRSPHLLARAGRPQGCSPPASPRPSTSCCATARATAGDPARAGCRSSTPAGALRLHRLLHPGCGAACREPLAGKLPRPRSRAGP